MIGLKYKKYFDSSGAVKLPKKNNYLTEYIIVNSQNQKDPELIVGRLNIYIGQF